MKSKGYTKDQMAMMKSMKEGFNKDMSAVETVAFVITFLITFRRKEVQKYLIWALLPANIYLLYSKGVFLWIFHFIIGRFFS